MLFRDFARWVLLAFGLFAFAVVVILVVHVGWFGPGPREGLHTFWASLDAFYREHRTAVDWAVFVIGIGGSVVTAILTVHRSWYYAEFNLPNRIRERIERAISTHLNVRPALLATVNDPIAPSSFVTPVVHSGYFDWAMKASGLGRARALARSLVGSLDTLKNEIEVVAARKRELETQAVTAYLLRGAYLAGQAALERANSSERREKNQQALQEFVLALKLKADDLDALELAAKQSILLGEERHAVGHLEAMAEAARDAPLRRARALRLHAEILEKRSTAGSLDEGRGLLAIAIDEVLDGIKEVSPERTLELAKAYRVRGEIQMKREKFTAARTALNQARTLFQHFVDQPPRLEGLASTDDALRRLDEAQKDREAPGSE
jgi:tetratricopeptide (TPR) repeat protein